MSRIIYQIEKHTTIEWVVTGRREDENIREVMAKCNAEGIALTIKGMYEKEQREDHLEALCRQLAEAGQNILPRFIELRHYHEKKEGMSFAQDFEEAEVKMKAALDAAKKLLGE